MRMPLASSQATSAPHPQESVAPLTAVKYFAVESVSPSAPPVHRHIDPGAFYEHLLLHTTLWTRFHMGAQHCTSHATEERMDRSRGGSSGHPNSGRSESSEGSGSSKRSESSEGSGSSKRSEGSEGRAADGISPFALQLHGVDQSSEGTRLVDMARSVLSAAMSAFVGLRPNYGDGGTYWGVGGMDNGALPLESLALSHGLLLWGHSEEARQRIECEDGLRSHDLWVAPCPLLASAPRLPSTQTLHDRALPPQVLLQRVRAQCVGRHAQE